MKIIPKEWVENEAGKPLTLTKEKREALVTKAKSLLTKPMETNELLLKLEEFYTSKNEHYTSAQLKDVVMQVKEDLTPKEDALK